MSKPKALFVLTGHDRLGDASDKSADKTGFHLFEAAKPWAILTDAGIEVDIVTPGGGNAPIDPSSRDLDNADNVRFINDQRVNAQIDYARPLEDVNLDDYAAIYFPGGHGTMWDLPDSEAVRSAVTQFYEQGKTVAAVCHGPAALVNVRLSDGRFLVDGKTVAAFTDEEERAVEKDDVMPFALSSTLAERGATLKSAANFEASVAVDDNLVTGQNPASAKGVGEAIRDLILKQSAEAA